LNPAAEVAQVRQDDRHPPAVHALLAMKAVVMRELLKFARQWTRLVSALVRPMLWLVVFSAGFRNVFGVAIVEPYDTYIPYDVYIAPGLVGMVLLFNGMQSSLSMVVDRELGVMRLLLTAPLPRAWLLLAKLVATAVLSLAQAVVFVAAAVAIGTDLPWRGPQVPMTLLAIACGALMLGALGLMLSVSIRQLENFAGAMNFVIFPMYFMSTALYPLWKFQEAGTQWLLTAAQFNPFTHVVEWIRFAAYGKDPGMAPWVVIGCALVFFVVACIGYDPQRGVAPKRQGV
jgi:ABC-2 type transport system permease protein